MPFCARYIGSTGIADLHPVWFEFAVEASTYSAEDRTYWKRPCLGCYTRCSIETEPVVVGIVEPDTWVCCSS